MESSKKTSEEIKKLKLQFLHTAKSKIPEFRIDERNRETIGNLFDYFLRIDGGILDANKGIWIEGPCGTGKTSLMTAFSYFLRNTRANSAFKVINCATISNEYSITDANNISDQDALDKYTFNRYGYKPGMPVPVCFDELGRETIPAVRYGQRLNVMQYIMHTRYTLWQQYKLQTYVTTNSDAVQIEKLYGEHIRDRRAEMFNIICLDGKSRRN